jgi:hypothetical protein
VVQSNRRKVFRGVAWLNLWVALLASSLLLVQTARSDAAPSWELIRKDAGIATWMSTRAGQDLPAFRARTTLDASMWEALAVLEDVDRACEWTAHCIEMRQVKRFSERDLLVYARMDAPWPVRDRDVVTRVTAEFDAAGELVVRIRAQPTELVPEVAGVVRMPRLVASYRFRLGHASETQIEYEAEVDPGGSLPDWLKRMVARNFPHDTLSRLRDRVRWTLEHGIYHQRARALEASARATGFRSEEVVVSQSDR